MYDSKFKRCKRLFRERPLSDRCLRAAYSSSPWRQPDNLLLKHLLGLFASKQLCGCTPHHPPTLTELFQVRFSGSRFFHLIIIIPHFGILATAHKEHFFCFLNGGDIVSQCSPVFEEGACVWHSRLSLFLNSTTMNTAPHTPLNPSTSVK